MNKSELRDRLDKIFTIDNTNYSCRISLIKLHYEVFECNLMTSKRAIDLVCSAKGNQVRLDVASVYALFGLDFKVLTIKETVYFTDSHGLDLLIHAATGMFYHGYQLGHDVGMNEAKQ